MERSPSDGRRRPHVVCLGAATYDTIFRMDALPTGPGKVLPTDVVQVAHGMASSAAAAIVKLGGRSTLFARVGDDAVGDTIVRDLSELGVDCRFIRRCEGVRSPICTVLVDAAGERIVAPYYDPRLERDPGWLPLGAIAAADAALVDVRWPEGAAVVLRTARDAGAPAVLDADVGPRDVILGLARLASHAVFSEPAATIASGESEPASALMTLAKDLDGFVAVTVGADGCFWFDRQSATIRQLRPPPSSPSTRSPPRRLSWRLYARARRAQVDRGGDRLRQRRGSAQMPNFRRAPWRAGARRSRRSAR